MGLAVIMSHSISSTKQVIATSCISAAILDFLSPLIANTIHNSAVGLPDPTIWEWPIECLYVFYRMGDTLNALLHKDIKKLPQKDT
jgi:uncharacterized membrane protein YkvI